MQTHMNYNRLISMNLVPNRVLIKPTQSQKNINLGENISFRVDKRFANEKHANVTGHIVNFSKTLIHEKMPWHTSIEIQVNDYVVCSYESIMHATDPMHGRVFTDENNQEYYLIDYEDIFTARREDQIIPVNGYILVSPITNEVQSSMSLPSHLQSSQSTTMGVVEHVGARNTCYYGGTKVRKDTYDFKEDIKKGDIVVFSQYSDLPLEFSVHKSIEGSKDFFRMQRRDILGIL